MSKTQEGYGSCRRGCQCPRHDGKRNDGHLTFRQRIRFLTEPPSSPDFGKSRGEWLASQREAEADRTAPHVSTLGGGTEPQPEEWWAQDGLPPPGAFWADDDEVGDWHGLPEREGQYPCGMCGGSGTSRFWHGATCDRCEGSGRDPYAGR